MARIVDAVLVDDQGADETAELEERVPVAPVAGQPRGLDGDHRADTPFADRRQQLLEAGPGNAAAGTAKIVVDNSNVVPPQLARAVGEAVLAALALQIAGDLIGRRLADVDDGLAGEVLRRDLAHVPPRLLRGRLSLP